MKSSGKRGTRIQELEQDLRETREHLQNTLEELETSSEELQPLNEELQSANEELQASNEELETSNEELQASNEELNTVNQELRVKSDELSATLESLESSEKRYRLLVDNMNEALLVCSLEYGQGGHPSDVVVEQINPAMESLLRFDPADLPIRASIVGLPELADIDSLEILEAIAQGGKPTRMEHHFTRLERDMILSVYPLDSGRIGIVCRDITQRKLDEQSLLQSKREAQERLSELEAIYESAPVGLCMLDTDFCFVRVNTHLSEINGLPVKDHIGRRVDEIVPDLAGQARRVFDQVLETGQPVLDVEMIGKTGKGQEGNRTWIEQWMPVKDQEGRVLTINVVVQDITERKLMEDLLRRHRDELESMVEERTAELEATVEALKTEVENRRQAENELQKLSRVFMDATDPIILEDLTGTITDMNNAALEVYGFSRQEMVGSPIETLIPEKERDKARKTRNRCMKGESVRNHETFRRSRSGSDMPVLITAFALKDPSGKPEHIVTIAKDITLLRQLQEVMHRRTRQLARLASELTVAEQRERRRLAVMLHDHLQQLMVGAKMKMETHCRKIRPSECPEIDTALELTAEAINASRAMASELSPPVLSTQGLVAGLRWLARQMKSRHDFTVELDLDETVVIEQEPLKYLLFESIRELLFNAVKHARVPAAELELSVNGADLVIVVSDRGTGFDPTILTQGNEEPSQGFGLFNIQERLQLLGGVLDIESSPQNGTRILLRSPMKTEQYIEEPSPFADSAANSSPLLSGADDPTSGDFPILQAPAEKNSPKKEGSDARISIMLADDHRIMRDALSQMLAQQTDLKVTAVAANGKEAVEMAGVYYPDVILMDINMPVMGGIEATRRITRAFPGIRVIGLTMHEVEDFREEMEASGAVAFFKKDGDLSELLDAIRKTPGEMRKHPGNALEDGH